MLGLFTDLMLGSNIEFNLCTNNNSLFSLNSKYWFDVSMSNGSTLIDIAPNFSYIFNPGAIINNKPY